MTTEIAVFRVDVDDTSLRVLKHFKDDVAQIGFVLLAENENDDTDIYASTKLDKKSNFAIMCQDYRIPHKFLGNKIM